MVLKRERHTFSQKMKLFTSIKNLFGKGDKSPQHSDDESHESIGISTVADYLHYTGKVLEISLKDSKTKFQGCLVDLSDDCKKLILSDVTEYDERDYGSPPVDMKDKKLIPIDEIFMVRVRNSCPRTDEYWKE
jgi:hypothetical protein